MKRTHLDPEQRAEVVKDIVQDVVEQLAPQLQALARQEVGTFAVTEAHAKEQLVIFVDEAINTAFNAAMQRYPRPRWFVRWLFTSGK